MNLCVLHMFNDIFTAPDKVQPENYVSYFLNKTYTVIKLQS